MSHPENRQHFQLERIILFSDAVFAIAITLLVLEIKLPDTVQPATAAAFDDHLLSVVPRLFGFLVSFFLIGFYWTTHHRIFATVIRYDHILLRLNLLLLFFIVLLPFSTSLLAEYSYLGRPYVVYYLNLGFVGLSVFFLQMHLNKRILLLRSSYESPRQQRFDSAHLLSIPLIFFSGSALALSHSPVSLLLSKFIYLLIGPVKFLLKKIILR
jgi:uncharacterized membrane protein